MAGTYLEIGGGGSGSSGTQPWQLSVATAAALPALGDIDGQLIFVRDTESIYAWDATGTVWNMILNGLADVSGPGSSTTDNVAVFADGSGKQIKEAPVGIDSSGNITTAGDITSTAGQVQGDSLAATSLIQFPTLTTAQRNALTAANGMVVYNTTDHLFQGYVNGSWINLHGWGF